LVRDVKRMVKELFYRCQKITVKGFDYLIEQLEGCEKLKEVFLDFEM